MQGGDVSPVTKIIFWAIPATILLIYPGLVDPINLPKMLGLWSISFTAVLLFILLRKKLFIGVPSRSTFYYLGVYALLAISMVAVGVFGSSNVIRDLLGAPGRNNGLVYYISIIALAIIVLLKSVSRNDLSFLKKVLFSTSLVLGAYCTLQFLNLDPVSWNNPYNRVIGTLGNPNFSSAALATFSVYWLYNSLSESKAKAKYWKIFTFFYFAFLAWSTQALQGLVIVCIGVLLVGYVYLREKFDSKLLPTFSVVFGGLGLFLMSISFIGLGPLGGALEQYTLKLRSVYASIGIQGMLNSPVFGVGIDNYNSAFRLYRTPEFVNQYGIGLNADNAHSTPAQIGATFGVVVFALYLALHLLVLVKSLRIVNSRDKSIGLEKGIAVVWLLIFAQSLLSIELIGLGVLNWLLGAVILSMNFNRPEVSSAEQKAGSKRKSIQNLPAWTGSATIGLLVVSLIPTVYIAREDGAYKNIFALSFQNPSDKDWVKLQYAKLSSLTLDEPSKVGRLLENMYNSEMNEEIKNSIFNVYEKNPKDVFANELMATYYRNNNDPQSELKIREELSKLDPVNYQLELTLARLYSNLGDLSKLKESVKKIESIAPTSEEAKSARELLIAESTKP